MKKYKFIILVNIDREETELQTHSADSLEELKNEIYEGDWDYDVREVIQLPGNTPVETIYKND